MDVCGRHRTRNAPRWAPVILCDPLKTSMMDGDKMRDAQRKNALDCCPEARFPYLPKSARPVERSRCANTICLQHAHLWGFCDRLGGQISIQCYFSAAFRNHSTIASGRERWDHTSQPTVCPYGRESLRRQGISTMSTPKLPSGRNIPQLYVVRSTRKSMWTWFTNSSVPWHGCRVERKYRREDD